MAFESWFDIMLDRALRLGVFHTPNEFQAEYDWWIEWAQKEFNPIPIEASTCEDLTTYKAVYCLWRALSKSLSRPGLLSVANLMQSGKTSQARHLLVHARAIYLTAMAVAILPARFLLRWNPAELKQPAP